jgi:hypothetical protein
MLLSSSSESVSKLLVLDGVGWLLHCPLLLVILAVNSKCKYNFENAPIDSISHQHTAPSFRETIGTHKRYSPTVWSAPGKENEENLQEQRRSPVRKMRKIYRNNDGPVYGVSTEMPFRLDKCFQKVRRENNNNFRRRIEWSSVNNN